MTGDVLGCQPYPGGTNGSYVRARMPERSRCALLATLRIVVARPGTRTPRSAPGPRAGEGESTAVRVQRWDETESTAVPSPGSDFATASSLASERERTAARNLAAGVSAMPAGMAVLCGTAAAAGAGRSAAWERSGESSTRRIAPSSESSSRQGWRHLGTTVPARDCPTSGPSWMSCFVPLQWRVATSFGGDPRQGVDRPIDFIRTSDE